MKDTTKDSVGCLGIAIVGFLTLYFGQFPDLVYAPVLVYAVLMIMNCVHAEAGTFDDDPHTYWDGFPRIVANTMTYTFFTFALWCLGGTGFYLRLCHVEQVGLLVQNGAVLLSYGISIWLAIWSLHIYLTQVSPYKKRKREVESGDELVTIPGLENEPDAKPEKLSSLMEKHQ